MRLIQAVIPSDTRDAVAALLEERDIDYIYLPDSTEDGERGLVFFTVPTESVEEILDKFRELNVKQEGVVVVSETQTVVSERSERQNEDVEKEVDAREDDRISRDELLTRATESASTTPNYVLFIVLSAVVATAGLLADSAAVVVGSMVIAPLLGPAIGASVGNILNDRELFQTSLKAQFVGLLLAVVTAAVFAVVLRYTIAPFGNIRLLDQVAERTNPGALSLVIAVASGVAGALSFTTGANAALVGVMMAAALIPPAAAVGLGIAYTDSVLAISAAVLVLVNVVAINLVGTIVLWIRGYRPERHADEERTRRAAIRRLTVMTIAIVVLSSFLVVTTADIVANEEFETAVDESLSEYGNVVGYEVQYETRLFSREPTAVVVQTTGDPETVADRLHDDIRRQTGRDVRVLAIHQETGTAGPAQRLEKRRTRTTFREAP